MQHFARMASEHSWFLVLEMLGYDHIGSGSYRDVFAIDDDKVIKIAKIDRDGSRIEGIRANIAEFELWSDVMEGSYYEKIRQWLAPIHEMTDDGVAIIQSRTKQVNNSDFPAKIPRWVTDVKASNCGMLNGKFVFHDYQWNLGINDMTRNHKLINTKLLKI